MLCNFAGSKLNVILLLVAGASSQKRENHRPLKIEILQTFDNIVCFEPRESVDGDREVHQRKAMKQQHFKYGNTSIIELELCSLFSKHVCSSCPAHIFAISFPDIFELSSVFLDLSELGIEIRLLG